MVCLMATTTRTVVAPYVEYLPMKTTPLAIAAEPRATNTAYAVLA